MNTCPVCGLPVPAFHPFGATPMVFEALVPTPVGLTKTIFCTGYHAPNESGKSEAARSPFFGILQTRLSSSTWLPPFESGQPPQPCFDPPYPEAMPREAQTWKDGAIRAHDAARPPVPDVFQEAFKGQELKP